MIKRDRQGLLSKIIYSQKFLAAIGLAVIVLISFPLAKNISRRYRLNQEIKEMEAEISRLETRNKDLKQLINYLESDQFVEEKARLNFGLKKEGESVVVIKEEESRAGSQGENNEPGKFENFYKWWSYFFKK